MADNLGNGDIQCQNYLRVEWQLGFRCGDFYAVVHHERNCNLPTIHIPPPPPSPVVSDDEDDEDNEDDTSLFK
ncbi:hypothetical protein Tco_1487473 [Tanacetum coccineum]